MQDNLYDRSPSRKSSSSATPVRARDDRYGLRGTKLRHRFQIDDEVGNIRVPLKRVLGLLFDSLSTLYTGEEALEDDEWSGRSSISTLMDSVLKTLWQDIAQKVEQWIDSKDPEIDGVTSSLSFSYAALQEKYRMREKDIQEQKKVALQQKVRIDAFARMLDDLRSSILKEAIFFKDQAYRLAKKKPAQFDVGILHFFQARLIALDDVASYAFHEMQALEESTRNQYRFDSLYVQLFGAEGKSHGPERPRDLENVEALLVELRNKRDREMDLILREQIVEVETQTDPVFISASSSDVSSVDSEEYEPSELSDAHDPFADESEPSHGLSIVVNGMAGPTSFGIGGRRGNGTPNSRRSPAGWTEIPSFAEEQKKQRQRASKQRHVGLQVYPPREDAAIETGSCRLRSYEAQTSPRLMRSMFPQFARTISWDISEVSDASTLKKAAPIDRAVSDERALAEAVAEKERAIFGTRTRIEQEEELLHAQMENELMKQEQLLLSEKIRNEEDAKWRPQVEYLQKQLDKANADIQRLKANTILPVDLLKSLTDNGDDVGSQLERVEKQFAMREREIERITRQLRAEKEAAVASLEAELVDARRRVEVARATMDPVSEEYALLEDEMQTLAMRLKLYKEEKPSEEVPIRFPSGDNIAIVFTDVENSTTMWEKHTKAMYQALKTHNRILRSVLFRYDGYAVKFEGDGSMLSFHTPLEAVRFCMEFQDELLSAAWPEEILKSEFAQTVRGKMSGKILFRGLRVRCGLHVGEPICAPDLTSGRMDYFGPMVNKAARVSSAAHGGQILCSHATWLQVRSYQQQYNFVGRDLKVHKLKGIEGSERIFQIASTDLFRRKFPPIRTEDTSKTTTNQELLNKYQLLSQKIGGLKVQMHSVGAVLDGVPRTGMQKRHPLVQECIKIEDSLTSLSKRLQLIREEKAIWQSDKTTPPSGKGIALVFTDVESSTALWDQFASSMYVAMKLHNKIMRDLLKKHNGFEIKTAGDGGFFSFWNGIDALNYLLDFQIELTQQEWPEEILNCPMGRVITDPKTGELLSRGLRVRAGIHVCDPICALDPVTGRMDYHGPSVNRSARVAGSGAGGQIVISQRCYDNVKHLTNELSFVVSDLGIHNFKGLESPEHVYQVVPKMFQGRSFKPLASESPSAIATEESLLSKYQDLSLRLDEVRTNIGAARRTLSNVSMVSGPESSRPAGVMHEQSEALFTREDSGTNMVVVEDEELSMDEGDDSDISSNTSVVAGDELRVKNVPDIQLPGIYSVPASDNAPSLVTTQLRLGEASEVVRSQILPRHSVETLTDTMTGGSGQVTKRDDFSTDRKAGGRWRTSMAGPGTAPTNAGGDDVDSKGRNKWQVMRLAKDILASENKEHHMQEQLLTLANWCKRIIHAYELALAALYAISQNVVARRDTRTSTDAQTAILDQFLRNLKSGSIEGNDSLNFAALLQSENSFLSGVNPSGWMNMLDPSFRAEIARCKNVLKPLLTKVNQMPKRSGSSSNLLNKILSGRPSLAVDGDDDDQEANEAEYLELAAIKAEADALSGDGASEAGSTNKGRRATDLPFAVDPIASLSQQAKEAASPMGPVKGHTPLSASSSMMGLRPGEFSSTPDFHLDPSRTNLYSDTNLDGSVRILNPAPWHNQMPEPTTGPRIHPRDPSFDNMRNVIQDELDAFERTRRLLEEQQHADKQFVRFSKPAQPDALEQRARAVQKLNEALAVSKAHERHMAAIKEQMEKELQEEAQRARDVVRPSSSMAVLMTAPRKDAYLPTSAEPKLVRHSTTGGSSANSSKTNSKFRSPSTRPLLSPIPPK